MFSLNVSTGNLTCTDGNSVIFVESVPYGKTIYIAIAPGTYTNFEAKWLMGYESWDPHGSKTKSSVTFEKGKIYDLGNTNDWH